MDYKEACKYLTLIGLSRITKEITPEDIIEIADQLKKDNYERYHQPTLMEFLKEIVTGK